MRILKLFGHILIVLILTTLTQVGGVIWLVSVLISNRLKKKKRFVFPILYLTFNLLIIPPVASYFGRERLPVFSYVLKPRHWMYSILCRNYVSSELKVYLKRSSEKLSASGISITYLDANFPFIDGFPLFPHLSHNDGKKIDISFQYLDKTGKATDKKPSVSGYGAYVKEDSDYSSKCEVLDYWQYDMTKYLTFGTINDLRLDKKNTKVLIQELLSQSNAQKLFIEPYLKRELGLSNYSKIRFHGCQAVRHDDHIHFQIK
ncbi:hypothetical protein [uncultured Psychroserpens sp.]|uniref:hypothetical protein n=1 Tax=uncultured Psychroserpens sp. TaxID=255436 RepID=UPI002619FD43|nr:hypothetical protein [uncultured Psychroserpens sp.]